METIAEYAKQIGFHDLNRLGTRTGCTCAVFAFANLIAPLFFETYPSRAGFLLGMTQGITLNLLFENKKIEDLTNSLQGPSATDSYVRRVKTVRFIAFMLIPVVLARLATYACTRRFSWRGTVKVAAYNYIAGVVGIYAYRTHTQSS